MVSMFESNSPAERKSNGERHSFIAAKVSDCLLQPNLREWINGMNMLFDHCTHSHQMIALTFVNRFAELSAMTRMRMVEVNCVYYHYETDDLSTVC